jgi:hypothetical protein
MNSDDFLDYFNKIDSYLRRIDNQGPEVSFFTKGKNLFE